MKRGAALIVTLFAVTVLAIFISAFLSISINQNINVNIFKMRSQAYYLAEAGLDRAITWLRAQGSPPSAQTNPYTNQALGGGTYSVTISAPVVIGGGGTARYLVTSTGSVGNINRTLKNILQVDSYARYIWLTNSETFGGTNVWFWTQDHLNGATHTNAHFNIFGDPVFEGDTHSVDNYIRFYNDGHNVNLSQTTNSPYDNPDFQQGVDFGATPEPINGQWPTQATSLRAAASSGGLSLQGDTTVVLNSNGTMNLTNASYCASHNCNNMALPANGALFVSCGGSRCRNGGSLTVSGTLNGRLTIGAQRDINIPDSIVYADNPRTNPDSDDTLGIIAEQDVVISRNAPDNIEIDGCVMALDTSFMVDNWDHVAVKDTLTVYGGIIQKERGPVGTFDGTTKQKVSGYSKDYSYDSRLLTNPPPFMPTTGDYVTLSWEED